jgi:prepilin-type N-terminal cleavage/methylation domain-containing protein
MSIHRLQRRARSGFTLIELLVVLIIISILTYFLVSNLSGGMERVKEGKAKTQMSTLRTMLFQYSDDKGDYPRSQMPSDLGTAVNNTNVGAECLYLALCGQGAPGFGTLGGEEDLCNTDGDALSKVPKGFERQDLFELADPWGNPIVYIFHADYEKEFQYVFLDGETGEPMEFSVRAVKNEKDGRFEAISSFQLMSAGADGIFGNADDIINAMPRK